MGWSEKGDERGKRFKVYQDLEKKYNALETEVSQLREQVRQKDALILRFATEMAGGGSPSSGGPIVVHHTGNTPIPRDKPTEPRHKETLPVRQAPESLQEEPSTGSRAYRFEERLTRIEGYVEEIRGQLRARTDTDRRLISVLESLSMTVPGTRDVTQGARASPHQPPKKNR